MTRNHPRFIFNSETRSMSAVLQIFIPRSHFKKKKEQSFDMPVKKKEQFCTMSEKY